MASKNFSLSVTRGESVRAVYQRPDLKKGQAELPLVVMTHGFPGGHKDGCQNLYGEMEERLGKLGYPTIRFDFRGCGESDGLEEQFTLDNAQTDLNAVLQWGQHDAGHRSFILIGESLGATVAVMGFDPQYVKAVILLWPALILNKTDFKALFTREKLLEADRNNSAFVDFNGHRLGGPFINEIYQYDLTRTLERIKVPSLIQHGTADAEVPVEQAYFGRDHLPGLVDICIFEGGDHGLTAANMRPHVFINIEYFLGRVLKKLDVEGES